MSIASSPHPASGPVAFVVAMYPWMILFSFWVFVRVLRKRRLDKAVRLMAQAAERFARGDDEAAAHRSSQVLALDPKCAQAFVLRGIILCQASRFMEAIVNFDRAIALMPQDVLALYRRATAKHCLGDLDGAIADYDRVMELEPGCADSQPGLRRRTRSSLSSHHPRPRSSL